MPIMLSSMLLALSLGAQDTVVVTDDVCATCQVTLVPVAMLGDTEGPGEIAGLARVVRDARGRYLVVQSAAPATVSVFSSDGRFLRSVGRSGGGPGEYRRIGVITPFRGGVVLSDDFARRTTVLDLEFELIGSWQNQDAPHAMVLQHTGAGVQASIIRAGDRAGLTLHSFDSTGRPGRSYSPAPAPYREARRALYVRELAPAADSEVFWVSHRSEYAFERCAFATGVCRVFYRRAEWFPTPTSEELEQRGSTCDSPPRTELHGVGQSDAGHVWAISLVADQRWRAALQRSNTLECRVTDLNLYFDTIIERIDVRTNRVVARSRVDVALWALTAGDEAAYYWEDAEGVPRYGVVRFVAPGAP